MIENYENLAQTIMLTFCVCSAIWFAVRQKSRTWILLAFFYGSWLSGNCYWLLSLIFYGRPQISAVSDLSWLASYLFLYLLLRQVSPEKTGQTKRFLPWLGPVFTVAMALYFMQWGKWISNSVYAVIMGVLLYAVISHLTNRKSRAVRDLCVTILIFCLMEYTLWISSCLWDADNLSNPYYWCDILLTVLFPVFIPATGNAVTE